jgi:predicted 2-oxoglutarate/Fe(II)-dependent dioxygenase YbiX
MQSLFIKRKLISDHILEDLKYDLSFEKEYAAKITTKDSTNNILNLDFRSATSKTINPTWYLDYCKLIEEFCSELNSKHIPSTLVVKEMEYLKYGISDHFKKHIDNSPNKKSTKIRRFSTITMLSKTDDLEGGDLLLFDENDDTYNASLEVGETILFYSSTLHQVTPITCGGREVLVSWVYDRI